MEIFEIHNNLVTPTPSILLIEPFSTVWEKHGPQEALVRFSYVEFYCSQKKDNPFRDYVKSDERKEAVLKHLEKDEDIIDADVTACIEKYIEWLENNILSIRFYKAAKVAADKLATFLTDFDMNATNERTGNPLYKPADITRALKETNDILKTLNGLEEKVQQEVYDDAKGKAGREINHFER